MHLILPLKRAQFTGPQAGQSQNILHSVANGPFFLFFLNEFLLFDLDL